MIGPAIAFLNPALAYGVLLGGIPILIYLWNRQRFRRIEWAAMEFLERAMKKNRRRLQIENLLLLLVRVAALVILALALARPVAEGGVIPGTSGPEQAIIVLDGSYSMAYRVGTRTAFMRAQNAAETLVREGLAPGSRATLAVVEDRPRAIYRDPVTLDADRRMEVASEIADLQVSDGAGTGADILRAVRDAALAFDGTAPASARQPKVAFVFTDLQRSAWLAAGDRFVDPEMAALLQEIQDHRVAVRFLDFHAEDPRNATVLSLTTDRSIAGVDLETRFRAVVKNQGLVPLDGLTVEIQVDGTPQRSETITLLAPGEEHEVLAFYQFRDPGSHLVAARLRGDPLDVDDLQSLALEVHRSVDVLIVDGSGGERWERDGHYLQPAIGPTPGTAPRGPRPSVLEPTVVGLDGLAAQDLSRYGAVILSDCLSVGESDAERLLTYVRDGGILIVFPGTTTDPALWERELFQGEPDRDGNLVPRGVLPARLGEEVTQQTAVRILGVESQPHPALRPFDEPRRAALLRDPHFNKYRRLLPAPDASVLLTLDDADRSPLLVERRVGQGRSYLFATAASPLRGWNDLMIKFAGPMLLHYLISYGIQAGEARRNLAVGEPFELVVPPSAYTEVVRIITPAGEEIGTTLERVGGATPPGGAPPEGPDRFVLRFDDTARSGAYEVRYIGRDDGGTPVLRRTESFAVNVDPREGDVESITGEDLVPRLRPLPCEVIPEAEATSFVKSAQDSGSNELAWSAAVAVLCLLGVESLMALWFGRERR